MTQLRPITQPAGGPFRSIEIVNCHAAGEVGDVIIGGVDPPPGESIWDQARWIAEDQTLRHVVLDEPRGGVFRHVNLLVPPVDPAADAAFIIMEPTHTPPMSGSNSMCVATVLLETGIVPMIEPLTTIMLEAPAGLVEVLAECRDGRVERVTITNVPSFAGQLDVELDVPGTGRLRVDTAYGGDTFVMVDAEDLGLRLEPASARDLAVLGVRIARAATEQLGFDHPERPEWDHISFCQFAETIDDGELTSVTMRNAVAVDPGKIDRSPTGTGVSARLAVLAARGRLDVGGTLEMRSIIDSVFTGTISGRAIVGERNAIVPSVAGRAWISGRSTLLIAEDDPWPTGYRLSDTWPMP